MKTTRIVCHVWNVGDGEYCGVYNLGDSILQNKCYLSQAFKIEVPDCPVVLTDAEKLEKLITLGRVYFDGVADSMGSASDDCSHRDDLMDLLKEYSK